MPSVENQVEDDRVIRTEEDFSRYDPLNLTLKTYSAEDETDIAEEEHEDLKPQAEDAEDAEYAEGEVVFRLEDFPDTKVFTTKQVAAIVGLKRDYDLRNLMKVWNAYINADRDDNGRYIWTKDSVTLLKEMLDVKRSRHLTVEKTLAFYMEPVAAEESTELSQGLTQSGMEAFANAMSSMFQKALEEKTASLTTANAESNARILEQMEVNKKESDATMQQVMSMLKDLQEAQSKKDEEIKRLVEENEALKADMEAQKKKKTFFGLLKG